jgi:hypothetical protein
VDPGYSSSTGLGRTLVESWNGTAWSVVPSPIIVPNESAFNGVFCLSAKSCVAVGDNSSSTLVESWNGIAWSVVAGPSPSVAFFYGVSCSSARSCKALGEYANNSGVVRALIESWNGTAWST